MARVECRFTFLDVLLEDEERGKDLRAGRARSEPPLCPEIPESPRSSEEALRRYVRPLPTVALGQVPAALVPAAPRVDEARKEAPPNLETSEALGGLGGLGAECWELGASGALPAPVLACRGREAL